MDGDTTGLLVCVGLVLVMVAYWTFYIRYVRRNPQSEEWYDSADATGAESDGVLFIYPYGTLIMGAAGVTGLLASANLPESVETVLIVPLVAAFVIGVIGFTDGDSASVVFCSALGRGHPHSKARATPRAQASQKDEKGGISLAAYPAS
ncbi:hypothetical protein [Corynebacterium sp. HMSC066C02]|uniref:hypothetical protein n=1 Tax=Corynebacterium sp. HMSC066C02 TaxID=1739500 RepID=UPI000A3F9D7B|nr:hypothetical protein [Corynebacterium sp. HMSC066C02]